MTASTEYSEYVIEHLQPLGRVETKKFFGGVGILQDGKQFAMIMDNSLYFVVDDHTRARYEQAGMTAFSYLTKKGRVQVRRYFELPEDVLTDSATLRVWARESLLIAAATKPKKARPSATPKAPHPK